MKVNFEKEGVNVIKMDITVPAKEAQTAYDSAVRRFAQYVNIDGFRKGKAPKNLVERNIGIDRIKAEALENLMPALIRDISAENNLDLITQPVISSYDFELGKDLKVTVRAEERPEVTLGKYKDLTVNVQAAAMPQDAFDKALENVLNQYAAEETVTDRAAKDTDIAVIDFDGSVNGEKIQGGEGKNYTLDLKNSTFIPGFAESITGHKTGEEFDINVTFPKEYHDEKLKGQPAVFKIKIHELKEKKLPELNDEFAQKLGPFKTVADLTADINKFLESRKEQADKQNSENEVYKKVIDASKVDIPQSMIDREVASMKEEYKARLAQQGVSWEMLLKSQSEAEIINTLTEDAKQRIRNSLVIDKIAKVEELKLEAKDLEQKFTEISAAYGMQPDQLIRQFGQNPEFLGTVSQQAVNDKVRDFLMTNNRVVMIQPEPQKTPKPKPAKKTAKKVAK
ncbi:MAG: trigger factor [Heliobacteriaceae bacterium]|jgi:trigger factor|nr:trigger factor [Heliobacteriaceae bacterium]